MDADLSKSNVPITNIHLKKLSVRPRVFYRRNPLVEVIAAIRFPPVMALLQEYPAQLQNLFSRDYPLAEVSEQFAAMAIGAADQHSATVPSGRQFRFQDLEKQWTISLESNIFALTCTKYKRWEEFRDRFNGALNQFAQVYQLPLITRFGLRYKDVIDLTALELEGRAWSDIVRPEVLQTFEFFTEDTSKLSAFQCSLILEIEHGTVRIVLGTITGPNKQVGLLIDTDCYVEPANFTSTSDVHNRAEQFHAYSGRIFQGCITDYLHNVLQPELIQS
jgi:uncharacterized protein (TIGR04255 family)